MILADLIKKYNVPAPRYTSYPTVPYWNEVAPTVKEWTSDVKKSFLLSNNTDGISLYIHLPFCESLCTYCGCNTRITKNHEVEKPYLGAVLKEWTLYKNLFEEKPIIKEIHLGGGTPTFFSPENLTFLINGLLDGAVVHREAEFSFEGHPNNTTKTHLQTLYNLGFRRVSFGIQDFDEKVQLIINRVQSVEQVRQVTEIARETGYTSINYDLIYGLPLQTLEGLQNTVNEVIRLKPDRIAFYSYAHVPWVKPGQRKFTEEHLPNVSDKQSLYETGRRMFIAAGYKDVGMDHFAAESDSLYQADVEGKLHRNFMGYTNQYTRLMIGLGVSSISDSWTAFSQNVKKVEEYHALVNDSHFPIFKGHILTDEDLLIRKHILNIMCKGETNRFSDVPSSQALADTFSRLKYLERDGLLLAGEYSLTVTPLGKRFLRNICMAFDRRLIESEQKARFSMAG